MEIEIRGERPLNYNKGRAFDRRFFHCPEYNGFIKKGGFFFEPV